MLQDTATQLKGFNPESLLIRIVSLALNQGRLLILYLFIAYPSVFHAQSLLNSRKTSFHTYIYQITDQEARQVYKKDLRTLDSSFFHTLVDSFPTDSAYRKTLKYGHYLKTFADKNEQKVFLTSVQPFEVFIQNNYTDLSIQIYDFKGNVIPDAHVKVRQKTLRFDEKTQSYRDKKSNQQGLLQVCHNGHTAFFKLSRRYKNGTIKRTTRKVISGSPVKYVWQPIRFTLQLPVDGIKSIIQGWPRGTIAQTGRFFQNTYEGIACWWDDYYCDENAFNEHLAGYMVFNQPKYQPGDTVRFKAYILKNKDKPIKKPVEVILYGNRKRTHLFSLSPYQKGGYLGQFVLHDSLGLSLNKRYTLYLEDKKGRTYEEETFLYEDYELGKTQLAIRTETERHFRDQTFSIFIKATDENDLHLMDARVEVLVQPCSVERYLDSTVFVPDTLLFMKQDLEPSEETEITWEDKPFPKANFDYSVSVKLLTADNEAMFQKEVISYRYWEKDFRIELVNDSLLFSLYENDNQLERPVEIFADDPFGHSEKVFVGRTPQIVPINPIYASYTIRGDSLSKTYYISQESSLLKCYAQRTHDSLFIQVDNPRNLAFTYEIFRKNTRAGSGYSDSLTIGRQSLTKQNYSIVIHYLWAGKLWEDSYSIPLRDKVLNLKIDQPQRIYPGQRTTIEVKATDFQGNPVSDVDITAYGLTSKFQYTAPDLPYLGKSRKEKSIINQFGLESYQGKQGITFPLHYPKWNRLAHLDTIEYYQFLYPGNKIYRFESPSNHSQIAPFIIDKGGIQPIYTIHIDSKPVFISWASKTSPYSFRVQKGYHQVKVRTAKKIITVDSLWVDEGKKLIFSLNTNLKHKHVHIEDTPHGWSDWELQSLNNYLFPYHLDHLGFAERPAYLEKEGKIVWLNANNPRNRYRSWAGPVSGNLTFHLVDSFSTQFYHEPQYEYLFNPGLLKMRSIDLEAYPSTGTGFLPTEALGDTVWTAETIQEYWASYLAARRKTIPRYDYPTFTSPGFGRLRCQLEIVQDSSVSKPVNHLLLYPSDPDFFRVYPGNTQFFHQLPEGYYQLISLYAEDTYQVHDSIFVRPNGLTFVSLSHHPLLSKDTFSTNIRILIEKNLFKPRPYPEKKQKEIRQFQQIYQQQFSDLGQGRTVYGYVLDQETGEPLVGATILIKGTNMGTITDSTGAYSMTIPPEKNTLIYTFVGFAKQEIPVGVSRRLDVGLFPDITMLEEVVVTGYAVSKRKYMTASLTEVTQNTLPNTLQGRVAGVTLSKMGTAPGSPIDITIRGNQTVSFSQSPLYIIDGLVYAGNIDALDESFIQSIDILKGEKATALYGARGVNGVVIISTQPGTFVPSAQAPKEIGLWEEAYPEPSISRASLRENFSDYAFWQPSLRTDEEGIARFEVTFPDDITRWETFFLAMNDDRQSGQAQAQVYAYKPLMAQLALPRFLLATDSAQVIGKTLNYTPDSVEITTYFAINDDTTFDLTRVCAQAILDTLPIFGTGDTLSLTYSLEKTDGYFDGEKRKIPVFPLGLEETHGQFWTLNTDTTITLHPDPEKGSATLYAKADLLEVFSDEISYLIHYKYECNEQLASKLKALLAERIISAFNKVSFKKDKEIQKIIRLLAQNQKSSGWWGWWKDSPEHPTISLHVTEALMAATDQGFELLDINQTPLEKWVWELEQSHSPERQVRMLQMLKMYEEPINFGLYISRIEREWKTLPLSLRLQLLELRQLCGLEPDLETLKPYRQETILGNVYYQDSTLHDHFWHSNLSNTLLAYRILQRDSTHNKQELANIRNYVIGERKAGHWQNTYESAQVIETLLPELLQDKDSISVPQLEIEGTFSQVITQFPYEGEMSASDSINIRKTGDYPVYLTLFQKNWNPQPEKTHGDFSIDTHFADSSGYLQAGKETALIVDIEVRKKASYVMINVPIPAGCSYGKKGESFSFESHREQFKHETAIFCEQLPKGKYTLEIPLLPRYSGLYQINPASISLMYFPTFSSNNAIKQVQIVGSPENQK